MDAIEELIAEHRSYSDMMVEFERNCDNLKRGDYGALIRMKKTLYSLKLEMEVHFAKEEYALFQYVNHPVIESLLEEHAQLREKFGELDISVVGMESAAFKLEEEKLASLRVVIDHFRLLKGMHVSKEENILFPYVQKNLSSELYKKIQEKNEEFDTITAKSLI